MENWKAALSCLKVFSVYNENLVGLEKQIV